MSWSRQKIQGDAGQPAPSTSEAPVSRPAGAGAQVRGCIGPSIHIKGTVTGNEDLRIDGTVEGSVCLDQHTLVVGEHAAIRADISASTVRIHGEVTGSVTASTRIEVSTSGSVSGDLEAPRMVVQDGACLRGRVDTGQQAAAETGETAAAPPQSGATAAAG